jgi:hypothetical protein
VKTVGESKAWTASRHSALLSTACQSLALLKRTPGQLGQGSATGADIDVGVDAGGLIDTFAHSFVRRNVED